MAKLIVTNRAQTETEIDGRSGVTVMELIRDKDVESDFALCGGSCSCATCHVYLDDIDWALFPAPSPEERALLDSSDHRRATSRLSCQLPFDRTTTDLRATIAPLD